MGPAVLAALLLLAPARSWAAAFGSIGGTVQDAEATPVSGALVSLQSPVSGAVRTVRTDASGRFEFPNVELGTYQLSVSRKGFTTVTLTVTIESGYFPSPQV